MSEYPNSDEEFELMYGDELELLREQEDSEQQVVKCRKSLNFTEPEPPQNELTEQNDSETPNFESEIPIEDNTKKRSLEELFGEIDDLLAEEIESQPKRKKSKTNQREEQEALIERILELRKLTKERINPATAVVKDRNESISEHNKYNLSLDVPKYPFVALNGYDGERIYVRCHSEQYEKEECQQIIKKASFDGILGNVWDSAQEIINKGLDTENHQDIHDINSTANISILKESTETTADLWVDLYKPKKYIELLSDESTNRTMLRWIKLWDKVVFNRNIKVKLPDSDKDNKVQKWSQQKQELSLKLDEQGRPQYKVALLCGPPGLGKTTLAHMVAKHAGYNVVEVNASDDRNLQVFKTTLENATQMRSVLDSENRPNCIIFDEIDGAPSASIEFLVKFINGTVGTKKKKQKTKPFVLKRPIICICNDVYVPALRSLRQIAFVLNFPPTASTRLAERLAEIARHQHIKADTGALLALAEKSNNDIRTCLSVLHFFQTLTKSISLSDVYKSNIGQKDVQKGLFAVWNEIFCIERSGDGSSLKNRMKRVLDIVNSFGDYERVAEGVFENYPQMNVKDGSMNSTIEALEWFSFTDLMNKKIYQLQNYSLATYLNYAFVLWHYVFSSFARPKLSYPKAGFEARTRAKKLSGIVCELMKGMVPSIRAHVNRNTLNSDVLPLLAKIIVPLFRPVNLHLYSEEEKLELARIVSIMIDYNLNYVQERTLEGSYIYNLDPNIDEIVYYPDIKPKRILSYSNRQLIAREIEVEKMRRIEIHLTGEIHHEKKRRDDKPKSLKSLKSKSESIGKDFFGRSLPKPEATSTGCDTSGSDLTDIWFLYKEGFSNAVRKCITIADLR